MKLDKDLAFGAGAAAISGIATAIIAPMGASKLVDTSKPENWYATGGLAVVLGAGIMVIGGGNKAATAAGAAMLGAGASFAYLGYQGYAAKKKQQEADQKKQAGAGMVAGPMNLNQPKSFPSWSGVPMTAQNYARQSGMPVRSR